MGSVESRSGSVLVSSDIYASLGRMQYKQEWDLEGESNYISPDLH